MIALVQVLIAAVLIPFAFAAPSVSIERPGLITIRPSIRLPVTKDGACGARAGFGCGSEGCCSRHGFCGTTPDHCELGCQSAFGACNVRRPPETFPISPNFRCGIGAGFRCGPESCCSPYNYCGTTPDHCGFGCQSAFGLCDSPLPPGSRLPVSRDGRCGSGTNFGCGLRRCCSKDGRCGTTEGHCGVGCQSAFGLCKAVRPPVG